MADAGAARCTGEATVGEKGNVFIQSHAGQYGGGIQHLPHARAAFGSFITDNDYIALVNLFGANGFDSFVFRVKYPGRTGMYQHLFRYGTLFYNRAHGRDVAGQYGDAAGLAVGVFYGADYIRTRNDRVFDQSADGLTGDGLAALVDESQFAQFVHDRRDAAGFVQVNHMMESAGAQFGQVRSLLGDFVKQG